MTRVWLAALLVALLGPAGPTSDPVLATFAGGEVRQSDVEREIRFLRRDEARYRKRMGLREAESWADWIRRTALRSIARQTATVEDLLEDPEVRELARGPGRDWLLERWAEDCYGYGLVLPDDATLAAEVAAEPRRAPARVRASHIFLRTPTDAEDREAEEKLRTWRAEISDPDDFAELARQHSDSQTARRGGLLGNVRRGTLSEEVESVLFALPAGTMSEPIHLRGGWHLFYVHDNVPERLVPPRGEIERARAAHLREARASCRRRRLEGASVDLPLPEAGNQEILGVGDWKLPATVVLELHGDDGEPAEGSLRRYVEEELLFQQALETDWVGPAMRRHLDDLADDVLLAVILRRRVEEFVDEPTEQELRAYAAGRDRPLHHRKRMRLDVLRAPIPESEDPLAFLDTLGDLASRVRAGELPLDQTLDELPPTASLETLPLLDILELAGDRLGPMLFEIVKDLPSGSISDPIQLGRELHLVAVREVVPGRDRTFEEAEPDLRRLWLKERRQELRAEITASVLERFEFELTTEGRAKLAALAAAGSNREGSVVEGRREDPS